VQFGRNPATIDKSAFSFKCCLLFSLRDSLQLKRGTSLRSLGKLSFAAIDVKNKGTKVLLDM
jgi:hypothetical protein